MEWKEITKEEYSKLLEGYANSDLKLISHAVTICDPVPVILAINNGEKSFSDMKFLLMKVHEWLDEDSNVVEPYWVYYKRDSDE